MNKSNNSHSNENVSRRIKKNIHAKPQIFEINSPPGFADVCERKLNEILKNAGDTELPCRIEIKKSGRLKITDAPFDLCHDLLLMGTTFSEVKIRIQRGRCSSSEKLKTLIESVSWNLWLPENKNIEFDIRVDSSKSHLHNEGQIKKQVLSFLQNNFPSSQIEEKISVGLDFILEKETLEIFLSLGGRNYWQRGQKQNLKHAAPLREDVAACIIKRLSELNAEWEIQNQPSLVINPFCGTGTLLHETALHLIQTGQLTNAIDSWTYQQLPIFKPSAFQHRIKVLSQKVTSLDSQEGNTISFIGEDTDEVLTQAAYSWFDAVKLPRRSQLEIKCFCRDSNISSEDDPALKQNQHGWIVANPPFGIRLSNVSQGGTEKLYANFAQKVFKLGNLAQKKSALWSGVILCPTTECWAIVSKTLRNWNQKCEHFTLGGKDIRALYFSSPQS